MAFMRTPLRVDRLAAAGIITPGSEAFRRGSSRPASCDGATGPRSAHRGQIDREAADVAAVGVANDENHAPLGGDLLDGEGVDAASEIAAAFGPKRGAFVLDERRLDLVIAHDDSRRVKPREVFAPAQKVGPDHQPVL